MSKSRLRILGLGFGIMSITFGACVVIFAGRGHAYRTPKGVAVADQMRLDSITAKAPVGESIQVSFPNMVFAARPFKEGIAPSITTSEMEGLLTKDRNYSKIRARIASLSPHQGGGVEGSGSISNSSEEPVRMCIYSVFCVQSVKVKGPGNTTKYYALSPGNCMYVLSSRIGQPDKEITLPKVTRLDFVNPQDVDWMFGVDDFAKDQESRKL